MTKKEAALAINETAAYIERNGGIRSALYEEVRTFSLRVYEIATDFGPASVSLIPSASGKGPPWLALQFRHLELALEAMKDGRLSRDVNPFSGKFNCHILDDGRTAQEVAGAFQQHLTRAGFPIGCRDKERERIATFVEKWDESSGNTARGADR